MQNDDSIQNHQSISLRSDSHLPKKNLFVSFSESPLKMTKNALLFHLKSSSRSQDI